MEASPASRGGGAIAALADDECGRIFGVRGIVVLAHADFGPTSFGLVVEVPS